MKKGEVEQRLENIGNNLKLIDNIFSCMSIYFKGESSEAIRDMYSYMKEDIMQSTDFVGRLRRSYVQQREQ